MIFDPTITLGNLVTGGGIVGSILIFALTLRNDVRALQGRHDRTDLRLDKVDIELAKQTDILITLGRQEQRMDSMEGRLDDALKRLDRQTFFVPSGQPIAKP